MLRQLPPLRIASYILLACAGVAIVVFHLGPAALAGLFSYTIIDATHRKLSGLMPPPCARWVSLAIFLATAVLVSWMLIHFLRQSLAAVPAIVTLATPKVVDLAQSYNLPLPFDNINEARQMLLDFVKKNANQITRTSGLLTKGFFHIIIAILAVVLCFFSDNPAPYRDNLFDSLRREFNERVRKFMQSFERVLGAQLIISAINTCLTAIFLLALGFPHIPFLVLATFILGILPVVGNICSNSIIVGTALTLSPQHAVFALCFLVFIHKAEYVLNSHIVGSSIEAPMWQTLLGILVGEVVLGVPGIILAPAMLHYIREELVSISTEPS